ncbi:hypothetical protein LXL04_029717 [Taraxacum kok-saghyz]
MGQAILAWLLLISLTICPTQSTTTFIQKSCSQTLYPQLCNMYLSRFSSRIKTSPRLLAQTALAATLSSTRTTSKNLTTYSRTHKLTKRELAAMKDCLEELSDSAYELHISMVEMDDDTCTDGFSGNNMNGEVKTVVRKQVLNIAHLASIALSFVNNYAKG